MWRASVLTLFPEAFPGILGVSLIGKALETGNWKLETLNIRDYAHDKHSSVDDTPYGGGAGMIMKAQVLSEAIQAAEEKFGKHERRIYVSPKGKRANQEFIEELAKCGSVLFLCGRYEGIDERVIKDSDLEEVSVGDFVLAGGEVAVMALIEAAVRLLPGVLGNAETLKEESFNNNLLEYPQYTKPYEWKGITVPEVLISGNHAKVNEWRWQEAEKITKERRPDLLQKMESGKLKK
ncbi:MAG: tRNA (guanosine(37)-N1)-methyltransferase TrmD [Alphaproteobacteria bacterium]|nr:tRNA (guanosine(37)-N1)-methyltransferase TrmD [Alphaproteobacteria bacterium]MCL2505430.1 tRNA (guanosine(37)-N1)-methyltransferase TrmD [Alphaproteobacteria bacterium]